MSGFSFSTNPATSSSPFSFSLSSSSSSQSQSPFPVSPNPSSSSSLFGASAPSNSTFGAPASSTPSFGFSFAPSSSSTPSSAAPSPSLGFGAPSAAAYGFTLFGTSSPASGPPFGGSNLFGSSSSAAATTTTTASIFGSILSSPFGTSSLFGASSSSGSASISTSNTNTNTTANSLFSSALFGSSSTSGTTFGATPSLTSSTTSTITSETAPSFPKLFGSSSSSSASATTPSFPNIFGASSSSSASSTFTNLTNLSGASSSSSIPSSVTTQSTPSATPSFSFSGPATSAPSFSFSTSSLLGKSTAAVSSSGSAPSSSPATSILFANVTASYGLQSSSGFASSFKTASTTATTTTAAASATVSASKTSSFPAFGETSSAGTTTSTPPGSVSSFASPATIVASTGTSYFLGFQTSSKTTGASTPASQPQSTAALTLFGVPASTTTTSTDVLTTLNQPPVVQNEEPVVSSPLTTDPIVSSPLTTDPIADNPIGSEPIPTTTQESRILENLQNLNVSIPADSPVIPPALQSQSKESLFENIGFTEENVEIDDEDFNMAPIELVDDEDEDENENELMSIKQFKILNRKLNMILRFSEHPADLSTSRETEMEKLSLEWGEKFDSLRNQMNTLTDRFDIFKYSIQKDNQELRNEIIELKKIGKNLEEAMLKLHDEVSKSNDKNLEDIKQRLTEANLREAQLQKALDDSLSHIKFMESSMRIYDQKELVDEYNENVVKHMEMVQNDFIARFAPLQKLFSRLPKVPPSSTKDIPIAIPPYTQKLSQVMNMTLFSVSSQPQSTTTLPNISASQICTTISHSTVPTRPYNKGIVIGISVPIESSSIIVTTQAGSSTGQSDKEKGLLMELSKEEKKQKESEERDRIRQHLSLIRQGEISITPGLNVNKIWTEETIRNIAFGDDIFINFLPKESYSTKLQSGTQLDLPIIPKLFTVKCFKVKSSVKLSFKEYKDKLIRFYGVIGKDEEEVWSLKSIHKIVNVEKGDMFENTFQNYIFNVIRGDSEKYSFTLADLPMLNPNDLIQILKILFLIEKVDVTMLIDHIRMLLQFYINEMANQDVVLAKAIGKEISGPILTKDGLGKISDGKILQKPEWGVVFSSSVKGKNLKKLFRIDDRGKFSNDHTLAILKRTVAYDGNNEKEIKEVNKLLTWSMTVRNVLQESIPVIFNRR